MCKTLDTRLKYFQTGFKKEEISRTVEFWALMYFSHFDYRFSTVEDVGEILTYFLKY